MRRAGPPEILARMRLRTLSTDHISGLLAFEQANRAWFEKHIEARPASFYSKEGVTYHVRELLNQKNSRQACPCVIEEAQQIIGRVNLIRLPGTRMARLGYRVAQQHRGKGVASFGVSNILERRHEMGDLDLISAFVSVENFASQRVLAKHGFTAIREHLDLSRVENRRLTCIEYSLVVSPVI